MDTTNSLKLPPKNYRRIIEELSVDIPDPALKLRFLKQAINEYQEIAASDNTGAPLADDAFRKKLLDNAENLWPGSKKTAQNIIQEEVIDAPKVKSGRSYGLRYVIGSALLLLFILGVGTAIFWLPKNIDLAAPVKSAARQPEKTNNKIRRPKPKLYTRYTYDGNAPPSPIAAAEEHQDEAGRYPKFLQNPILIALTTTQQSRIVNTELAAPGPLASIRPSKTEFQVPGSNVESAEFQNQAGPNLKFLQNPILLTLTTALQNKKGQHLSLRPHSSETHTPASKDNSAKYQIESWRDLRFLQNPIILALTDLQQNRNTRPDHFANPPLLPRRSHPSAIHAPTSTTLSAKYQDKHKRNLNLFQSPILLALTPSDKSENFNPDYIDKEPLLARQPHPSAIQAHASTANAAKYQTEIGQNLNFLQSPILMALTTYYQNKNADLDHITQRPLLPDQPPQSGTQASSLAVYSEEYQFESGKHLNFLQNPILMALTSSQRIRNSHPDLLAHGPFLSSWPPLNEKHKSSPIVKSAKYQNKPDQNKKYLRDPIFWALKAYPLTKEAKSDHMSRPPLKSNQTVKKESNSPPTAAKTVKGKNKPEQVPEYLQRPIWLVEKTPDREFYSNRLQIITTYATANVPREYYRFPKNYSRFPANIKLTEKISGIVYHASESDLYPFMPEMNRSILKYSKQLMKYLLRKKSYHFFIDRFGRVYRLIQEDHAAFHAGNSIWADEEEIYLNLNHAFIGICFEGKDFEEIKIGGKKKGQATSSKATLLKPTGISSFNEAQLKSGKELTDWLRVKYKISQHNCVPHALISVNPDRMLIGWHLDLARGFPFAKFGLSDKYREPLPSIVEFGFRYDAYFKKIFNDEIWPGIRQSDEILRRQARNSGINFDEYCDALHQKFSRYRGWKNKLREIRKKLVKK